MRLEIARKFLTTAECGLLNAWALDGVKNGWLDVGISRGHTTQKRLTSRMCGPKFTTPPEILAISQKIRKYAGVVSSPLVLGHGKDGIVVSCTFDGGDVYAHRDPRCFSGLATLRCNVLTQKPQNGGDLYLGDTKVDLEEGDLHCYLASEHTHSVTKVQGPVPRVLWMFGASVQAKSWDNGHIVFGAQ